MNGSPIRRLLARRREKVANQPPKTPGQKLVHDLVALLIFGILLEWYFALGAQGCGAGDCVAKALLTPVAIIGAIAAIRVAFYAFRKK